MHTHGSTAGRIFSLDEANASLPLVRAIVTDLVRLSRDVAERRQRLALLLDGREPIQGNDPYHEELLHIEKDLEKDRQQLREYANELLQLGVEPKSATQGLVDFPTIMNGRVVYLCWQLGEPEIICWHETNVGFAGRQRLPVNQWAKDRV